MKNIELKLFAAFILLFVLDAIDYMIKSDLTVENIISRVLLRGSTLVTAWIILKFVK